MEDKVLMSMHFCRFSMHQELLAKQYKSFFERAISAVLPDLESGPELTELQLFIKQLREILVFM